MSKLEQIYAWSESRVKCLRECRRRYHLMYHVAWGGWGGSAPQESRRAYMLKNMTNLPMFVGSIVHDVIEDIIKEGRCSGKWKTLEHAQHDAVQLLRKGWKQSFEKRWEESPKYNINLSEHFYQEEIPQEKLTGYKTKILKSLKAFYDCYLFNIIKNLKPEDWLSLEDFQKFQMNTGEEVTVKIDCGFKYEGKVWLLDWKTGRVSDSVIDQLTTYAMYAIKQGWAKDPSDIIIVPVYLAAYEEIKDSAIPNLNVTMDRMKRQAGIIRKEYPLLTDAFNNKDDKSFFERTDNERACSRCFFRDMCEGADTEIGGGVTPF